MRILDIFHQVNEKNIISSVGYCETYLYIY